MKKIILIRDIVGIIIGAVIMYFAVSWAFTEVISTILDVIF